MRISIVKASKKAVNAIAKIICINPLSRVIQVNFVNLCTQREIVWNFLWKFLRTVLSKPT